MSVQPSSILILGLDWSLLETRRIMLQGLGYNVFIATSLDELRRIPRQEPIRLLVLCHSLSPKECSEAAQLAEFRWPGIRELFLGTHCPPPPARATALGDCLLNYDAPRRFIAAVRSLVEEPLPALHAHMF